MWNRGTMRPSQADARLPAPGDSASGEAVQQDAGRSTRQKGLQLNSQLQRIVLASAAGPASLSEGAHA